MARFQEAEKLAILESFARVLGKDARFNLSHASMVAVDLGTDLRNFLSDSDVNFFFERFNVAKREHAS